jgi:DNA polymerase elongation subunit (family B)
MDGGHVVPQVGYHFCQRKMGLIPEVLQPILERRFCYKARSKNRRYDTELYRELQNAWKWVLLVCFGYTGYRNARFGRIECYESITGFAREKLLSGKECAEQNGYEILHGIVDSLWVKPVDPLVDAVDLAKMISIRAGVRMDVEGRYKWIVFLPCKQGKDVGALTRYYGVFDTGEVKVRGVEIRQRNTPEFLRCVQRDMLDVLAGASSAVEFRACLPQVFEVLLSHGMRLIRGEVDVGDCVITSRVSRDLREYRVNTVVKSALSQLRELGVEVEPGQYVRYVVLNEMSRNHRDRVCVAEVMHGDELVDVDFYLRQIAKCGESLLIPFGYSMEEIEAVLKRMRYRERLCLTSLPGS